MYSVGDKVVHPMHGAGTIEEIKEIEIVGKKRQYYVLKFAIGNMVTNVPIENSEGKKGTSIFSWRGDWRWRELE